MENKKYLFFDTETTGLPADYDAPASDSKNWPRLVQLAWIVTDQAGKHLQQKDYIIKPQGFEIPPVAFNIHGISTSRAMGTGHDLNTVLCRFAREVNNANCIVAHNINFDINIVAAEFYRMGINNALKGKPAICTKQAGADICKLPNPHDYEGYKWPRLIQLYNYLFGEDFANAHDAFADIAATERCFWKMREMGHI